MDCSRVLDFMIWVAICVPFTKKIFVLARNLVFHASDVTDGGQGKCPPWQFRCWLLFKNGPLLIRLPFLPKQFNKLETFSLYKFVL